MKRFGSVARRAVTLTELLVVIVIISLLATIAVPTYVQKLQNARVSVARAEAREIAQAVQACAAIHGYIVPLRVLDNVAGTSTTSPPSDNFSATTISNCFLTEIGRSVDNQIISGQPTISDRSSNRRIGDMVNYWQGPFISYKRVWNPTLATSNPIQNPAALSQEDLSRDYPLDPWGRPYHLYSPRGITGGYRPALIGSGNPDPVSGYPTDTDNGRLNTGTTFEDGRFSTWAIMSPGPNGFSEGLTTPTSGSGFVEDDVWYEFSVNVQNESAYSVF